MATQTETATTDLVLTPPDPVPVVAPEKAVGLVPVDEAKRTQLQERVETFIDDLIAQDVNSPEFGKRVDAISAMGQKEIRDAAGPVEPLPRPAGQGDEQRYRASAPTSPSCAARSRISIPGQQGKAVAPKKLFGIIPFGNAMRNYFDGYQVVRRRTSPRS